MILGDTALDTHTSISPTGLSPTTVTLPNVFGYTSSTPDGPVEPPRADPTTPTSATTTVLHARRFRLFQFRSPLLPESLLFSLPVGTEMFHFPTFPPHALYIQARVTTHDMPRGFPIRTPSDHRSLTNSPRLIAGCHVLLRLLMPRHPPCALNDFHETPQKSTHASTHQPQDQHTPRTRSPSGRHYVKRHTKQHNTIAPTPHTHAQGE